MRQVRKRKVSTEIVGNILSIRAIEDSIRATHKYTKGAFRRPIQHPIQGAEFPSKVLHEYYEVYPETELSWDMSASTAIDWLWGDVEMVNVLFEYDYRSDKASVVVEEGPRAIKKLEKGIPGFTEAVAKVIVNGNNDGKG